MNRIKKDTVKFFRRKSSLAHVPPAAEGSVNSMQVAPFYSKLKFSVQKLKRLHWHLRKKLSPLVLRD